VCRKRSRCADAHANADRRSDGIGHGDGRRRHGDAGPDRDVGFHADDDVGAGDSDTHVYIHPNRY
jgi:hypothetical protein